MIIDDYDYYGDDESLSNEEIHMLVVDDDGHWYLINEDDKDNFDDWVYDMNNDKISEYDFDEYRINSPHAIRFTNYWEEE